MNENNTFIDAYSRKQAIEDDVLVEVTDGPTTRLLTQGLAVAFTRRAWDERVAVPAWATPGMTELAHVWDILVFLRHHVLENPDQAPEFLFGAPAWNEEPDGPETLGRVAAEALINGLPVIASDRGPLPETLGHAGVCLPLPTTCTPDSPAAPTPA